MRKSTGSGPFRNRRSQIGDSARQLPRAARRFAAPEWNRGRRALGVFDAHAAGFDPADSPRRRPEQEHVAGHALDREILVECANHGFVGLDKGEKLRVGWYHTARRMAQRSPRCHAQHVHRSRWRKAPLRALVLCLSRCQHAAKALSVRSAYIRRRTACRIVFRPVFPPPSRHLLDSTSTASTKDDRASSPCIEMSARQFNQLISRGGEDSPLWLRSVLD